MPNWCENTLHIRGSLEDIYSFTDKAYEENTNEDFSLNNFIPMPEELRNTSYPNRDVKLATTLKLKYGATNWYDWTTENWGTKWDVTSATLVKTNDKHAMYIFQTAWCPWKDEVTRLISEQFPRLNFRLEYYEPGMRYSGVCEANAGKILESHSKDY